MVRERLTLRRFEDMAQMEIYDHTKFALNFSKNTDVFDGGTCMVMFPDFLSIRYLYYFS
ncbi:hypothetical protein EG68_02895 [Paragonimus skrjabini miyazakii]|uniref:Uncharacterized protein n=1 Tax=Paragonimus skrjabini miyazakii TaxID=59628 RepID=A0A8S9Z360_9TREM|nr:hypothetical protein EG68_02895 [Paragonimus skrjabini miyazakii]